ncbi:metallophosphoesterase [Nostoc sp. PCC 7107]|uniref:metallophosphoesterase family protein n=1 Tax=Nostoc sp. PCC 7107 TaxID=317936 RepID=UPI00029F1BEE|nr:metallophosphoesterase [Nostoc sp. PCC 7107]AFY42489.1 metallophosphoesterase [Nostoc sp. PCC 7107]
MKLVSDPAIAKKIQKMNQRVRWEDPLIKRRNIDQTKLVLEDGQANDTEFSFLVVGDSGSGRHGGQNPQRRVAELALPHLDDCRFMLHTGDVIYLVGSSEYYQQNFIQPYKEYLVGGEHPKKIAYDNMTFRVPILPVPGNHDYYDLPIVFNLLSITTLPIRRLLRSRLDMDVGLHGSKTGDAYAKAFLDYLNAFKFPGDLDRHLDTHYTVKTDTGLCLAYQPGQFTRLPNRYYTFRYGGIDFFALDSNTFNNPPPLPETPEGDAERIILEQRRQNFEQEKQQILDKSSQLNPDNPNEAEYLDDLYVKLSQIEELIVDIDKQLAPQQTADTDIEQLEWLKQRLIASWHNSQVRGRVVYFHHPPYVTEATKWEQGQTLAIRTRLREVFNAVAEAVGDLPQDRAVVDLVLNGHAHCLEYLQTYNTGHADSAMNWIVCGGSGFSLRRQRTEGADLVERDKLIARSHLFVGRNGHGSAKRRPYSCLRIDVTGENHPRFIVRPLVAEWYQQEWHNYQIEPFVI